MSEEGLKKLNIANQCAICPYLPGLVLIASFPSAYALGYILLSLRD